MFVASYQSPAQRQGDQARTWVRGQARPGQGCRPSVVSSPEPGTRNTSSIPLPLTSSEDIDGGGPHPIQQREFCYTQQKSSIHSLEEDKPTGLLLEPCPPPLRGTLSSPIPRPPREHSDRGRSAGRGTPPTSMPSTAAAAAAAAAAGAAGDTALLVPTTSALSVDRPTRRRSRRHPRVMGCHTAAR